MMHSPTSVPTLKSTAGRAPESSRVDLGAGLFALVDEADFAFLNQWKWSVIKNRSGVFYANRCRRLQGKQFSVLMHRFLAAPPKGYVVDHRNGDTLDNRKENLRVCLPAQNATSRKPNVAISGYRGVKLKESGKYFVQIKAWGKTYGSGPFDNAISAAHAYDALALMHKGEFAVTNFGKVTT